MAYQPLKVPPHVPQTVRAVVGELEKNYLRSIHVLFKLPIPNRATERCTFQIADALLAVVSGVSTLIYPIKRNNGNGFCFRKLLEDCYPWCMEPNIPNVVKSPSIGAQTLWDVYRNPLTHSFGIRIPNKAATPIVKVKRGPRRKEKEIKPFENNAIRPNIGHIRTATNGYGFKMRGTILGSLLDD